MADISNVRYEEIKDITDSLEGLSCKWLEVGERIRLKKLIRCRAARILTRVLY